MRLRVIGYNVHGFRGGIGPVAGVLAEREPDFVCLQECGSRRALRAFAGRIGMEPISSHRTFNRVRNAVLVRRPWRAVDRIVTDLSREGDSLRRGFVAVRAGHAGARVTVISTHFGLSGPERLRHAAELTDSLAGLPGPYLLGADLNEDPDGKCVAWIAARLFDCFEGSGEGPGETFPASNPSERIDYVFASGELQAQAARVLRSPAARAASDHLPVEAEVLWSEPDVG